MTVFFALLVCISVFFSFHSNAWRFSVLDIADWMELVGFSLANVVPSLQKTSSEFSGVATLIDPLIYLCETGNPYIFFSALCSLSKQTAHFSQFLTASRSGILPVLQSPAQPLTLVGSYSNNDTIGYKGIVFIQSPEGMVSMLLDFR